MLSVIKKIYEIESYKYRKKGTKNILIAYVIIYLYLFQLPNFFNQIWPENVEDKLMFQLTISSGILVFGVPFFSLIFLPGYLGVKYFKKYEI